VGDKPGHEFHGNQYDAAGGAQAKHDEVVHPGQVMHVDPQRWHKKPNSTGPCEICGVPAAHLKALHRADKEGGWSKTFKVGFGGDSTVEKFGTAGWPGKVK